MSARGRDEDIIASAHVVEQILDRVIPGWRASVPSARNRTTNRWCQHREASGQFREAVTAVARKVNAEAQNKLGRRDVSETNLFEQAFSTDAPRAGQPRLRLQADDDSDTFRSRQRGAMSLAEACFAGIRNPNSHEDGLPELPENEALEQLATISVLARWVEGAAVENA